MSQVQKPRIALVVQRCAEQIPAGAEKYAFELGKALSEKAFVDVYTSQSDDYISWNNKLSPYEKINDQMTIFRFAVKHSRWRILFALIRMTAVLLLKLLPNFYRKISYFFDRYYLKFQGPWCPELWQTLNKKINQYDLLIVKCYLYAPNVYSLLLAQKKVKTFFIVTAHDELEFSLDFAGRAIKSANTLGFVSLAEKTLCHATWPESKQKSFLIVPPGLPLAIPEFQNLVSTEESCRSEVRNLLQKSYFLHLGRMDKNKNLDFLFAQAPAECCIVFAGARYHPIPKTPQFVDLGVVTENEKIQLLKHCLALVTVSRLEAYSMSTAEALAMGKPVVALQGCAAVDELIARYGGLSVNAEEFSPTLKKLCLGQLSLPVIRSAALKEEKSWSSTAQTVLDFCAQPFPQGKSLAVRQNNFFASLLELKRKTQFFFQGSFALLGRKGFSLLFLCAVASVGIVGVELFMAAMIQVLLVAFGFLNTTSSLFGVSLPSHLTIGMASVALCVIALLRFVVQLTSTQVCAALRDQSTAQIRTRTILDMLYSSGKGDRIASEVNFKITEIANRAGDFVYHTAFFISMSIQCSLMLLVLSFLSWRESLAAFLGILLIAVVVLFSNRIVSQYAKKIPQDQQKLSQGIQKVTKNFPLIYLSKKRDAEYCSLKNLAQDVSQHATRAAFFANFASQMGPFLGIILLVIIILLSQNLWFTPAVVVVSFIYLLVRFVQSLSILSGYFGNSITFLPQYKFALNLVLQSIEGDRHDLSEVHGAVATLSVPSANAPLFSIPPEISFRQMTYAYEDRQEPLFDRLNMTIASGQQFGLMGQSGTGKSTLLFLIAGLLKPQAGAVTLQNISASSYALNAQARVGYVGPEPFLVAGSLRENLLYGVNEPKADEKICEVLRTLGLDELASSHELDRELSEDQSGLSAGQKQRVCLARAFLGQPKLLLLDEATANLDETNERLVAEALKTIKGSCTTVIVSHRPGVLMYTDVIVQMSALVNPETRQCG